jgi:hypothetical protein
MVRILSSSGKLPGICQGVGPRVDMQLSVEAV